MLPEYLDPSNTWSIHVLSDDYDNVINEHFTFYLKDAMIQEHHTQHVFNVDTVRNKMLKYFKLI